jgi:hypothetical protein
MFWDWSTAGKKKDGKPFAEKGPHGKSIYDTKKGDFRWEKNVQPAYFWFNGAINAITARDTIDPSRSVDINWPVGSRADANARIFPFKVHEGRQPYDKINKTLSIPKLFGKQGSGAYWAEYDWKKAQEVGMQLAGLSFSGEYDFVDTRYVFPITHMVAPKENAVACIECHNAEGRLATLSGFYMPGRDDFKTINIVGWVLVLGTVVGVTFHGLGRALARRRKEN